MTISTYDDVIDSWDVIDRIEELRIIDDPDTDEVEELRALLSLQKEAEGYSDDWTHGVTLIRDSYFKTYAEELANDIGAINSGATWPNTCIDWEQAARELQMDYTSVEFDGIDYWIR